jgi:hypothetical protein
MKHTFLLLILTLIMMQLKAQSPDQQVLNLSREKFQWQLDKNWSALSDLMDDNIILQHGNGNVQAKEDYFKTLKSGFLEYKMIDVIETSVKTFDKTSVVMGKVKFQIILNGELKEFDFQFTEVYVLMKDKWSLILYTFRNS